MLQAVAALAGAIFAIASCYAAGSLLIRRLDVGGFLIASERLPLSILLGAACVHLVMFAVFAMQAAYWPVIVGLLLIVIGIEARNSRWATRPDRPSLPFAVKATAFVCAGAFGIVYFVNAWAPEFSPDGSMYHLGILARYLRHRGMERITTNMYAALGGGIEMIFAPAFVIGRHSAAALTHLALGATLTLSIAAYGRRIGKPMAGIAAAVLVFVTPVFGRDATIAYVDAGVAALVFATFYWLRIWDAERDWRLLIPAGLLAGHAFAAKYTAVTIGIYAIGLVLYRTRSLKLVSLVAACAFLMAGPWVIRNGILYQNPVAPMGNAYFPNPYFYPWLEQDWAAYLRVYELTSRWQIPWEVLFRGRILQGILGPFFVAMPLALLALRYAEGRRLLLAGIVVFSTYPANIGTRFLIPCFPFFVLALTMAASERGMILSGAMLVHSVLSWPDVTDSYARYAWRIYTFPWRAALRIEPQDAFLRRMSPEYAIARMVEDHVPREERVLTMNGIFDAYTTREIMVSFQSGANTDLIDLFHTGREPVRQPLVRLDFHAAPFRTQKVRVVESAPSEFPVQWNIHELHFYHQGRELERKPSWRLHAQPNPWDITNAFDGSLVTRWRSWEAFRQGANVEVDFGAEETIDEVRITTSPDFEWAKVRIETQRAEEWQTVAAESTPVAIGEPRQVRREAMHELALRGVHYLVIHATAFGAEDVAADPDGWGLRKVAEGYGATLYRTIW